MATKLGPFSKILFRVFMVVVVHFTTISSAEFHVKNSVGDIVDHHVFSVVDMP